MIAWICFIVGGLLFSALLILPLPRSKPLKVLWFVLMSVDLLFLFFVFEFVRLGVVA